MAQGSNTMDTRFLQSFIYVVETGSIAAAARRLDLTPASVAQRIKALETDVGSQLIVRAGRTVKPTLAGNRILQHAHTVLNEVRDLRSVASETSLPAGPLRLGATPTGLTQILPGVLKQWVLAHAHIEIYIEPAPSTVLYQRLLNGHLDAAVMVHPLFDLPKSCAWHGLRKEPLTLVTPSTMLVSDPIKTLATEPFIRYDRQVVAGKLADDYLRHHGVRPRVRFELDGIESIGKLVAEGLGISVLPDWNVGGPPDFAIKRWALPPPHMEREVGIVWTRAGVRAQLAQTLVALAAPLFKLESVTGPS
ncbi:LysR family transcriptional regulator [Bordetella tumulicola]